MKLAEVCLEFKHWIFKLFSIISIQHCNWGFISLINNRGNEWYSIRCSFLSHPKICFMAFDKKVFCDAMECISFNFLTLCLNPIESRFYFFIIFDTLQIRLLFFEHFQPFGWLFILSIPNWRCVFNNRSNIEGLVTLKFNISITCSKIYLQKLPFDIGMTTNHFRMW